MAKKKISASAPSDTIFTPIDATVSPDITPISTLLRTTREDRGISIEEVADTLRISKFRLRQLETDEAPLMCDIYTRGFLRNYATFLGLDPEPIVAIHENLCITKQKSRGIPEPLPMTRASSPRWGAIATSLLLITALVGAVIYSQQPEKRISLIADNTIETTPTPTEIASLSRYSLQASEPVWVEVLTTDGDSLSSQIMQVGDTYEIPVDQNVMVSTENLGAVQLVSGHGKPTPLGAPGERAHHYILEKPTLSPASAVQEIPQENSLAESPQNQ